MAEDTKNAVMDEALMTEGEATPPAEQGDESAEVEILRAELATLQEELARLKQEAEDYKAKHLRALAEMQTVRRRVEQDVRIAREQGADSVILSVLPVYDDLRRALDAARDDPAKIIPGIEQVRETLRRNLGNVGIIEVGKVGDDFNPEFHEALTAMPTDDESLKGKIAQVFESGFVKDDRVVRVARVVVYQ
jgi:molecular chaperone GrpE